METPPALAGGRRPEAAGDQLRSARGAGVADELSVVGLELSVALVDDELSVVDGVAWVDEVSFGIVLEDVELSVDVAGVCAVEDDELLSVV